MSGEIETIRTADGWVIARARQPLVGADPGGAAERERPVSADNDGGAEVYRKRPAAGAHEMNYDDGRIVTRVGRDSPDDAEPREDDLAFVQIERLADTLLEALRGPEGADPLPSAPRPGDVHERAVRLGVRHPLGELRPLEGDLSGVVAAGQRAGLGQQADDCGQVAELGDDPVGVRHLLPDLDLLQAAARRPGEDETLSTGGAT